MSDAPRIVASQLRELVADAEELQKGARLVDDGALEHLARFENRLYADARGSGPSPYKVQITFDDTGAPKGRCACMAARSRPFCKHAAALLVAWARTPEAFAVADTAPAGAPPAGAKKRAVKKGAVDDKALMRGGVEQVATLVRELAVAGVAGVAADRAEQVRALGASLREQKLRRLSARTLELAGLLGRAAARDGSFDASAYAELMGDLLLTARKLERHIGGEPLEEKHVEELVGKTWTKKDRKPIDGLTLVEYAFLTAETADGFVIRESRLLELATGAHYSEKQIIPAFLAKRTEPKKSSAGRTLEGARGSTYPGYAPIRLDLEDPGTVRPLAARDLAAAAAVALPGVAAALEALQGHRKDVFAPDELPVAIAVHALVADGARMQIMDASDAAIFLPDDRGLAERLAASLHEATLKVLIGDLVLDGALPTLIPHAVLAGTADGDALRPLAHGGEDVVVRSRKIRPRPAVAAPAAVSAWTRTARGAGLSSAAIALGEVRAELADLLAGGLAALSARRTESLVSRLEDLSLAKQAELLASLSSRNDPAERLDDFVKLHQVLGIALARLAGSVRVDRARLVAVPTYESVRVAAADERLEPREIARRVASGELNRFQAAVRYAAHYERLPPEAVAASLYPIWADGSATPFVVRALRGRGRPAVDAAFLALDISDHAYERGYLRRPAARTAALTAVRVLEANAEAPAARELVAKAAERHPSSTVRAFARLTLRNMEARRAGASTASADEDREQLAGELRDLLISASDKDVRARAAADIAAKACFECIPYLRASYAGDVSRDVRREAALALGQIGDSEMVDVFVRALEQRAADHEAAKTAARALGYLGDVRGIDALLDAWVEAWQPGIIGEALRDVGGAALDPLLARIEGRPELAKRKAAVTVLRELPDEDLAAAAQRRLEAARHEADFAQRAAALLTVAAVSEEAERAAAGKLLELVPMLGLAPGATRDEKALRRRAEKALGADESDAVD